MEQDDPALKEMIESMRQLLTTTRAIAPFQISEKPQHVCEPLLPLIANVLSKPESQIPIYLGFGMEVLLSSYRAYMWPQGERNKSNSRITALQFAREVEEGFSAAVTCLGKM